VGFLRLSAELARAAPVVQRPRAAAAVSRGFRTRRLERCGAPQFNKGGIMAYASLNRVTLIGNLTHDPELRELASGRTVCHIRVACNGRRRTLDGGYDSKPNYFDVSVFGAPGESVHRYLRKGRPVAIDGRLEWSEWETAEGQRRQSVTIVASDVQFLRGSDADADGPTGAHDGLDGDDELAGAEAQLVA
jgi:single-strand DNA-binding protein